MNKMIPAPAIVLCRIVFGLILFIHYLRFLPYLREFTFTEGLGGFDFTQAFPLDVSIARETVESIQKWSLVSANWIYTGLMAALLLSSLAFALGFLTPITGLLALLLHTFFHARSYYAFWGWSELIKPFLIYLLLCGAGRYFSVDEWMKKRSLTRDPEQMLFPSWPIALFKAHICIFYFIVGWARLPNPHWRDGSMLFRILSNSTFSRFPYAWKSLKAPLWVLTYGTWTIELLAPFTLWLLPLGGFVALAMIGIHLGLEAFTNVEYWNFMMIPCLLLFIPTSWLRRWV